MIAKVPEEDIGDPVTESIEGTVIPTEVTVPMLIKNIPEVAGAAQAISPPTIESTWPVEPVAREVLRFLDSSVKTSLEAVSPDN